MPPSSAQKERFALLKEEVCFIHRANYEYWRFPGGEHSRESRAQYEWRRIRLDEIREERLIMANSERSDEN